MPNYKYDNQVAIIGVTMAFHDFIMYEAIADCYFKKEDNVCLMKKKLVRPVL